MSREPLKPGDLVILKAGGIAQQEFIGQIHTLGDPLPPGFGGIPERHWRFDPAVFNKAGDELAWGETRLQKIENPGDHEIDQFARPHELIC